jgi:hypothetical protein
VTSPTDREVAWLVATDDGLPALRRADGGPWDVVQGYATRTPSTRQTGIYLLRRGMSETRLSNQRKIQTHQFRGKLWWPIGASTTSTGLWEDEQRAFDDAIDLLVARIRGTVGDHTHGGGFLSVAEAPQNTSISVAFVDPDQTLSSSPACLRADISYSADDRDFTA